uniref:Exported protein n=1 Tax=Strongyloides stercoralis TaxID=6248 RepID=A0A0K0EPZ2_STRER
MTSSDEINSTPDNQDTAEEDKTTLKDDFLLEDKAYDYYNTPIIGTENLEFVRSRVPTSVPKSVPYGGVKYVLYFINGFLLLLNLVFISIIINSVYFLKYSPIKRKRNEFIQENFKVDIERGNKNSNYNKLKHDLENLKKKIDKKDKDVVKKSQNVENGRNNKCHKLPVVKMDEEKLAEVFHLLAKMPNEKSNEIMNKSIKNKGVVMIGEDETICLLNNDNGNKKDISKKNKISKPFDDNF